MRTVEVWHILSGLLRSTESHLRAKVHNTVRYDTNSRLLIAIQHSVIAGIPTKDKAAKNKARVELPVEKNSLLDEEVKSGKVMVTVAEKRIKFKHVRTS
jgi:hypothetical protein